jgi:tripartite-type tricarboxylate transporter receptor subunit TctC
MPDVPTTVEQGFPKLVATNDYMLFAPTGTPKAVLDSLYAAVSLALKDPDVVSKMALQGAEIVGSSPAQLAAYVNLELPRWKQVVQQANIKAD